MKNPRIATCLKYYRKLNKLSVNEVADILKEHNISSATKTIYGWENGRSQPDADTFMLLCEIYNIDNILEAFGYIESADADGPLILNREEKELVIRYRNNPEMQSAVNKLLDIY
ncbi:MAG: helix-turn-helix transcriptional regulator [Lachnospiraceae bacterium]|nr:helix-turn-helix transcriptional regulator [Lachnospiraceae bacterium]